MPTGLLTVSQYVTNPPMQLSATDTLEVRGWYTRDFIGGDGVTPIEGNYSNGQTGPYYSITPTLNASGNLVVPAHEIQATTLSNPTGHYIEQLWVNGAMVNVLMPNTAVATGWQIPTVYGDPISFDEIATYNRAKTLVYRSENVFTADDTILEILRLAGVQNYAGLNILGRTELDWAPAVASLPKAIGVNSPRAQDMHNVLAYGASGDGTTDNLTVLSTLASTTLQITGTGGDIYFPAGTYYISSDIGFPSNIRLVFDPRAMLKPATGSQLTILGFIDAGPWKIFANALAGQGTIMFTGNKTIIEAPHQWWGGSTAIADNGVTINAAAAALATIGSGEVTIGQGDYPFTTPIVLGGGIVSTGIGLGGSNALVGSTLTWNGATNATAIKINRGRCNYLHDFYLLNGVAQGTTNGILATGPNINIQTAHVHLERVTLQGFAQGYQAGEVATNSANDETLFTQVRFVGNIRGFYAVANLNNIMFAFNQCVFATNTYGVYSSAGCPIVMTGTAAGHNTVDAFITNDRQSLLIVGWDGEVSERFIVATASASVEVHSARLRQYTLTRADGTALIETSGALTLDSVFQGGNSTSVGATGPHFIYATGRGISVKNCYFPDTELPHIDPSFSTSDGLPYDLFNNYAIDNTSNAIISRFPDATGMVIWPSKFSFSNIQAGYASTPYTPFANITANVNNYNPGGFSRFLRLTTDASRNVTGLTFTTAQIDGQTTTIINVGAQNIVLVNDATSTAANRFLTTTGSDITLTPNQQAVCVYDSVSQRWRVSKLN